MDKKKPTDRENFLPSLIDAIDITRDGIIVTGGDGIIRYCTDEVFSIFGIGEPKGGASRAVGKPVSSVLPSLMREIGNPEKYSGTARHIFTIDGDDVRQMLCERYPCSGGGEELFFLIFFDITRYTELEIELLTARKRFESMIDSIPDIVYTLDEEGLITFINEEIRRYGYTPEELIGRPVYDIIHPDDREKARFKLMERRSGTRKTRSFDVRMITKDKSAVEFEIFDRKMCEIPRFSLSAEGIYIYDKNGQRLFTGTQGIARDVTRRKVTESVFRMSEERWRIIVDGLKDGYYEVDLNGVFTFCNNMIIEYTSDDILGKSYREVFTEESAEKLYEVYKDVFKTGSPRQFTGWFIFRNSKKKYYIEGSVSPIWDEKDKTIGFRGIVRDSTEKQRLEQELLHARKLEAIGILAGGIAHDYNNALTAVMGNISLAKMEAGGENKDLQEILSDAESASHKILALTKRLSTFARGGTPIKRKISPAFLLRETAARVLADRDIVPVMRVPDDLPEVEIDEVQLSHVFEHVLSNAAEAMPDGGTVTVSAEKVMIEEEATYHELTLKAGEYVRIEIRDQGIGIRGDDIYKIFDPYFTTKEMGSGMGLAICYAVIKRHHGYIDVDSEAGKGTVFSIFLPVP